ncbi:hypothetical protein DID88_000307 [Monilinia fructigena]|uniref:Uncharacterized protein n=1 Tax=Monilinia fructigena TaxID=38457 RepID=A0A395IIG5_9HELO|nr:hypothetical protein DID88_000307 [Monilinia fructigena]
MDQDQDHSKKSDGPTKKRRKLDDDANDNIHNHSLRRGMNKSISPPPLRRRRIESPKQVVTEEMGSLKREGESDTQLATNSKLIGVEYLKQSIAEGPKQVVAEKVESLEKNLKQRVVESPKQKVVKSPFQLTSIRDLPASSNLDTVSLKDILGDPLISECWEFNYLHNLDFLMEQFAEDIRNLVKVNVIHGFWKREDQSRLYLMMFILFRHDSTAQVIIHTANMIPFDWTNMTQAMWKSPLLPLLDTEKPSLTDSTEMGSGGKFKLDLLNYLRAYDTKRIICKPLIEQLSQHDFSGNPSSSCGKCSRKAKHRAWLIKNCMGLAGLLQKYSDPYLAVEPNQK